MKPRRWRVITALVQSPRWRGLLMVTLGVLALAALALVPPIPQDPKYHAFPDQRSFVEIPSALNVVSNIPFLLVGAMGLWFLLHKVNTGPCTSFIESQERWPFVVFFAGLFLTGLGSAYYHWAPSNATLLWDRLPITILIMSLFASVIGERVSPKAGLAWLFPLVALGIGSVVYWYWSELHGGGDLRLYAFVQFGPLLLIAVMLVLFPDRYTRASDFWAALALYLLAKVFEYFDAEVFALGRFVSGHMLKHLASAVSAYWILRMLKARRPIETQIPLLQSQKSTCGD
jgi:predicted membrane channel-forming protein YqfA (hemolysin III family)